MAHRPQALANITSQPQRAAQNAEGVH